MLAQESFGAPKLSLAATPAAPSKVESVQAAQGRSGGGALAMGGKTSLLLLLSAFDSAEKDE